MKLQTKHKQLIAFAIGLLIVLFGILQILFHFNIDSKVTENVTLVLFLVAFSLLFSSRSKKGSSDNTVEQSGTQNEQAAPEGIEDVEVVNNEESDTKGE